MRRRMEFELFNKIKRKAKNKRRTNKQKMTAASLEIKSIANVVCMFVVIVS